MFRSILFSYIICNILNASPIHNDFISNDSPWIDLPLADYKVILGIQDPKIEYLNQLIKSYHSIEKSSLKTQLNRIHLLNTISDYLEKLIGQGMFVYGKSTLLLLNKAVQCKREYIKQLIKIPSDEEIESYHLDYSALSTSQFTPIVLRNNNAYSLKMKEFWGKFWLESVDPCHRRIANYYHLWLKTQPACQSYQSFFLWMEAQLIPKNIPLVNYYSDLKLQSCHVKVVNGYLRKSATNELLNTDPSKRNLYVINIAMELYLEPWKEGVWHTSLSRGKPVFGAGLLQIEEGIVKMIAFESGHYLPTLQQSFQSLQILRKKKVRFKEPLEVIYFENRNKYKVSVLIDDLGKYQDFYNVIHDVTKRILVSSNEF